MLKNIEEKIATLKNCLALLCILKVIPQWGQGLVDVAFQTFNHLRFHKFFIFFNKVTTTCENIL